MPGLIGRGKHLFKIGARGKTKKTHLVNVIAQATQQSSAKKTISTAMDNKERASAVVDRLISTPGLINSVFPNIFTSEALDSIGSFSQAPEQKQEKQPEPEQEQEQETPRPIPTKVVVSAPAPRPVRSRVVPSLVPRRKTIMTPEPMTPGVVSPDLKEKEKETEIKTRTLKIKPKPRKVQQGVLTHIDASTKVLKVKQKKKRENKHVSTDGVAEAINDHVDESGNPLPGLPPGITQNQVDTWNDEMSDVEEDDFSNYERVYMTDSKADREHLITLMLEHMPEEVKIMGESLRPVNMGFRQLVAFSLSGLGGSMAPLVSAIGASRLADKVPDLVAGLSDEKLRNDFRKVVYDSIDRNLAVSAGDVKRMGATISRDNKINMLRRSVPSVVGGAISGISSGLASGSLNTGISTAGVSMGAGMLAQEGTTRILNKMNVSDTTKSIVPPLVGLGASVLAKPAIDTVGGTIGATPVLPTQVVQSQTCSNKRKWKPREIIPSADIVEPTENQAILNQIEYSLFDYIVEGSEGGNGTDKTNDLMKSNTVEHDIRFLGWQNEFSRRETEYKNDRILTPNMPPQSVSNWDQSEFEDMPKIISPELMGYNTPYGNFTQVVLSNKQIKNSVLYGIVP
tara:strand:+ start:1299 stop:3173 length:1875 start_codon:yes stop_codon:yes gene_type:complete